MKSAEFWERESHDRVKCLLCPHGCVIKDGATGRCRARTTVAGELKAAGYGLISSAGMDPIEKKPLYHFRPGETIFSIGGWGCNFSCVFCQNWSISQELVEGSTRYEPSLIVKQASDAGSMGIAYTYNEPIINYEFVRDCSVAGREAGLANVLVTNGFVMPEPADRLLPLIDAVNIDIKSMEDSFYREQCGGRLEPVLDFALRSKKAGCHVEITNLVIPGLNDSEEVIEKLAVWVRGNLGEYTPLHLSAYYPQYKSEIPSTPQKALEDAHRICSAHLAHVYLGNTGSRMGRDTVCAVCGVTLVSREGYKAEVSLNLMDGKCLQCGAEAHIS